MVPLWGVSQPQYITVQRPLRWFLIAALVALRIPKKRGQSPWKICSLVYKLTITKSFSHFFPCYTWWSHLHLTKSIHNTRRQTVKRHTWVLVQHQSQLSAGSQPGRSVADSYSSVFKTRVTQLGLVHAWDSSTWEMKAEGLGVQSQLQLYVVSVRPSWNKNKHNPKEGKTKLTVYLKG